MLPFSSYLSLYLADWVSPVRDAAAATVKITIPKVTWVGIMVCRNLAVALSQQRRTRKVKKPNTNCTKKTKRIYKRKKNENNTV